MQITKIEVRIAQEALDHTAAGRHLSDCRGIIAYCVVYYDNCHVIKEVRVVGEIDGLKVSMPARKLEIRFACGHKNDFDHNFCARCGRQRAPEDAPPEGSRKFMDMCHPTTQDARRHLNERVITAVREQLAADLKK